MRNLMIRPACVLGVALLFAAGGCHRGSEAEHVREAIDAGTLWFDVYELPSGGKPGRDERTARIGREDPLYAKLAAYFADAATWEAGSPRSGPADPHLTVSTPTLSVTWPDTGGVVLSARNRGGGGQWHRFRERTFGDEDIRQYLLQWLDRELGVRGPRNRP
jgi:hypothetical protein